MARGSLLLLTALCSVHAQQVFNSIELRPTPSGVAGVIRMYDTAGFAVQLRAPIGGASLPYTIKWPVDPPPVGGGYLYTPDSGAALEWQTPAGGGGGTYTFTLPLQESLGVVTCSRCMRNDDTAANIPSGSINLGSSGTWFNAMYSGTFQVPVSGCANSALVTATALFGGDISVKNSSCVVTGGMTSNGVYIQNTGSFRVGGPTGSVVIDNSRNATVNNLTILGTCTGCPGGGGGGGVSAVYATIPIVSSGGTTPMISCPTCMTSTATTLPSGGVNLGSAAQWFNAMYAGTFAVSVGGTCTDAAYMTATALFGGDIYAKNSSCAVTARMNTNGLYVPQQAAITGQRYACIDTTGRIVSSASACSGT